MSFTFHDPGKLIDGELELVLVDQVPGRPDANWVPAYRFSMRLNGSQYEIGQIDLRIGDTDHLRLYGGHIGYMVKPDYRGHHYAARACRLLYPLARSHGMQVLWITCNPDNYASRRTAELAGGQFVEIVNLPEDVDMYHEGERQKCRYRVEL